MINDKKTTAIKKSSDLVDVVLDPAVVARLNTECKNLGEACDAGNGKACIQTMTLKLSSTQIQAMLDAIAKDTGGDNEYKIQQCAMLAFGADGKVLTDYINAVKAVKEGIESIFDFSVHKALTH